MRILQSWLDERFINLDDRLDRIEIKQDKTNEVVNLNTTKVALTNQKIDSHRKEHHGIVDWMTMGLALIGGFIGGTVKGFLR